jgi:hypothetical protein
MGSTHEVKLSVAVSVISFSQNLLLDISSKAKVR